MDSKCPVCQDMGYICGACRNPLGECTCNDGPDEQPCPEDHSE